MLELGDAARAGDVARVKSLLREGVQVNSRDSRGRTALHYACKSEHKNMQRVVDVLLDAGAKVNAQDEDEETPLHVAVQRISFQTKLEKSAAGGKNEETPLAISSKRNEVLVKTLLRKGALVNVRDSSGRTALHWACTYKREVIEDKLLEAGPITNIQKEKGRTHFAVDNNEVVKALLVNITSESFKEKSSQHLVDRPQDEDKVRMVNSQDEDGNTALHLACERLCLTDDVKECVCLLLCEGAEVGVTNNDGETSLHSAACHCRPDVVDIFLNNGEYVNATDNLGKTPLLAACDWEPLVHNVSDWYQTENVRLLYRKGAKVGVKTNTGETAMHIAARYGRAGIVEILLNNGEDVNAKDDFGETPLNVASESGRTETIRFLYRKGAKVGVKNNAGKTPLHKAAAFAKAVIVDILVDQGEYVSAEDIKGNTPLHYVGAEPFFRCINNGEIAFIINFLITRGAKIDQQNIHGETPHEHIKARLDNRMKTVETTFITQAIRLKTLGLQDKCYINWIFGPDFYDNVKFQCCQELESMKSTMVVKDISLYQVLSHISQPFLVSTEDLQHIDEFLSSPDLLTRFPLYGDTLRITFQRAKLLTLAVQSFYSEQRKQMMKKIPCEVTEQLVNFLSNKDLRMFIESE